MRYNIEENVGDYVHTCNSGNTNLDNEDVIVTGDWEDYTGSKSVGKATVMMQGSENKLFGTRAGVEGEHIGELDKEGKDINVYRERQYEEYISMD
jgi:hypothetical protein